MALYEGTLRYNKTKAQLVSLKPGRDFFWKDSTQRRQLCLCVCVQGVHVSPVRVCACLCVGPSCTSGYCCHSVKRSVSPHDLHVFWHHPTSTSSYSPYDTARHCSMWAILCIPLQWSLLFSIFRDIRMDQYLVKVLNKTIIPKI